MTDDRPQPRYGQYAPVPATPPEPVAPMEPALPPADARPRRLRDIVVTTLLLLLGVADVASALPLYADLAAQIHAVVYTPLSIEGEVTTPLAGTFGLAVNIARVGLLVVTIVVSLVLIARRRLAFWVPLVGYLLATLVTTVLVFLVLLNDPAYMAWIETYQ